MKTKFDETTKKWSITELSEEEFMGILKAAHHACEVMRWEPEERVYYINKPSGREVVQEEELDGLIELVF